MKEFAEKVKQIEMPAEMQERIRKNCYEKMEEENMKKSRKNIFQKPMVAVAALALCLCVTGSTYEQASDEVEIVIGDVTDSLEVNLTFLKAKQPPYSIFETLGIQNYQIQDKTGKAVVKGAETKAEAINNGKVQLSISLKDIPVGEYKLVVTELVGGSKADQPLVVKGTWECGFTKGE